MSDGLPALRPNASRRLLIRGRRVAVSGSGLGLWWRGYCDEDRSAAVVNDACGDRTEECVVEGAVALVANDDEYCVAVVCLAADFLADVAVAGGDAPLSGEVSEALGHIVADRRFGLVFGSLEFEAGSGAERECCRPMVYVDDA